MAQDSGSNIADKRLFSEKKIKEMNGYKRGTDYIEVKCGCTSKRYGDTIGALRVHTNGQFLIVCDCNLACQEKLSPYEFEKHAGKQGRRRWQSSVWVMINDNKVPLRKTPLVKYYKHLANGATGTRKRNFHRDEFITCSKCKKQRRFQLRNQDQIKTYHDASLKEKWKCSDCPNDKVSCEDEEERGSRKRVRGCPRAGMCKGCTRCVCFGCLKCRFVDCTCRTCLDYMQNADP